MSPMVNQTGQTEIVCGPCIMHTRDLFHQPQADRSPSRQTTRQGATDTSTRTHRPTPLTTK